MDADYPKKQSVACHHGRGMDAMPMLKNAEIPAHVCVMG